MGGVTGKPGSALPSFLGDRAAKGDTSHPSPRCPPEGPAQTRGHGGGGSETQGCLTQEAAHGPPRQATPSSPAQPSPEQQQCRSSGLRGQDERERERAPARRVLTQSSFRWNSGAQTSPTFSGGANHDPEPTRVELHVGGGGRAAPLPLLLGAAGLRQRPLGAAPRTRLRGEPSLSQRGGPG